MWVFRCRIWRTVGDGLRTLGEVDVSVWDWGDRREIGPLRFSIPTQLIARDIGDIGDSVAWRMKSFTRRKLQGFDPRWADVDAVGGLYFVPPNTTAEVLREAAG